MKKLYGVGVFDGGYVTRVFKDLPKINGKRKLKLQWACPYYTKWKAMLERCYSTPIKTKRPTYKDCTVCEEWLTFSNFKKWMELQDWEGKHLDKDLRLRGNKLYGPDTCIFIDPVVNSFITARDSKRGEWPVGVHWSKKENKFIAQCKNPFSKKLERLGGFSCPLSAHEAWLGRKRELAHILADQQTDEKVASAIINYFQGDFI